MSLEKKIGLRPESVLTAEEQDLWDFLLKKFFGESFQFGDVPKESRVHLNSLMNHDLVVTAGIEKGKILFKLRQSK